MKKIKYLILPLITIIVMLILNLFLMVYNVSGDSMNPTLLNGKLGIAVRNGVTDIKRFDIVVVKIDDKYIVKRVIGLPNDTVKYVNQQLIVNGERINEWYTEGKTEDMNITLGTDEYFCLGDNREHSKDSRVYGAFTNKQIKSVLTSMRGK